MRQLPEFVDYCLERMSFIRGLNIHAMFGGYSIYQDDYIFAIIVKGTLYFKVDIVVQGDFVERGLLPFNYVARGKLVTLQYFEAPPEVFEESDTMRDWVRKALDASIRQSSHSPSPSLGDGT